MVDNIPAGTSKLVMLNGWNGWEVLFRWFRWQMTPNDVLFQLKAARSQATAEPFENNCGLGMCR